MPQNTVTPSIRREMSYQSGIAMLKMRSSTLTKVSAAMAARKIPAAFSVRSMTRSMPFGSTKPPCFVRSRSVRRAELGQLGLELLQRRIRIVAGLLGALGPDLDHGLSRRTPFGQLCGCELVDLTVRVGLQLGDAGMLVL